MEPRHWVTPSLCDFQHLGQLVGAASCKVQERQSVKILGLLVRLLHDLQQKTVQEEYYESHLKHSRCDCLA